MSITLSADTFTQMTNDINADRAKIRELEEKNKKLVELHNLATTLANTDVKELQEENKKLKEENEEQKKAIQSAYEIVPVDTLKKIEELKEENKKLREELKLAKEAIQSAYEIVSVDTLKKTEELKKIEELKEEYKKLQEELKLAKKGFRLLECVDCKCIILDDLQGQINKLKEENEKSKTDALCFSAQLNFAGEYSDIQDYTQFNEWIKENYKEDEYKKMYEWYVMEDYIEEE